MARAFEGNMIMNHIQKAMRGVSGLIAVVLIFAIVFTITGNDVWLGVAVGILVVGSMGLFRYALK